MIIRRSSLIVSTVLFGSCRAVPSINLLGSFFPGWMLCMIAGVLGALLLRQLFLSTGLDAGFRPRPLVYLCLWGLITLLLWLPFFRS
jgi:hypothetical protein